MCVYVYQKHRQKYIQSPDPATRQGGVYTKNTSKLIDTAEIEETVGVYMENTGKPYTHRQALGAHPVQGSVFESN